MNRSGLRGVAWFGVALLAISLSGSFVLLLLRYTAIQESGARLMALAGLSSQLLLMCCGLALLGAAMTLGEIRTAPRSKFRFGLAAALVPCCLFLWIASPMFTGWFGPAAASSAPEFTLLEQNLWYRNEDPAKTAEAVLAEGAQVLVLMEYTPAHAQAFRQAGVSAKYPYRWSVEDPYGHGLAVFSKLPVTEVKDLGLSGSGALVKLRSGGSIVDLYAVHFNAPTSIWDIPRWRSDFTRATNVLKHAGPFTVVAGDLNATDGHIRMRKLLRAAELRDAQDVRSVGFAATWPARGPIPTVLRLDHILLGPGMGLNSFRRMAAVGSDHLGLIAGLSVSGPDH